MKSKIYFHRTPGAKFYMPNGDVLTFSAADGKFETTREDIQFELDRIADNGTSHVYTQHLIKPQEEKQVAAELQQNATAAFDGDKHISGQAETVAMHMPQQEKPTLKSVAATGGSPELNASLAKAAAAVRSAGTPVAAQPNPVATK